MSSTPTDPVDLIGALEKLVGRTLSRDLPTRSDDLDFEPPDIEWPTDAECDEAADRYYDRT